MAELRARFSWEHVEATTHWCSSPSTPSSHPLFFKNYLKNIKRYTALGDYAKKFKCRIEHEKDENMKSRWATMCNQRAYVCFPCYEQNK